MSAHFRGQITLLNEEAVEILNSRKDFLLPLKVGGQSDKEYTRVIETILNNLDAEYEEILDVSNQLADNETKWSTLRTNMTGNERIQDNTEYDAFIVAVPFVKTISDLRRYLRNIRSQRRLLEAAIPFIENTNAPIGSSLIHLPKTQLPTFSGDCVAFLSFWNTFKAGVHDLPISDSIKFTYLKQCLSGSPLTLISSLPVTDESYQSALELLRKNYDNPNEVARSLHNLLRKLPHVRAGENFCTDLRLLLDKIEGICVQMSQRNQSFNTTSFQMEIEERLPRFVLDEIFKAKDNDPEWDSLKLKEHLHHILKRKEQIESLTLSSHNTPKQIRTSQLQTPSSQNNKPPPILSFHTQGENQNKNNTRGNNKKPKWPCLFCENPSHFSANCETYLSINQRKDKLRALKRCFSCLRPNHLANQCTKPSLCSNCQGKHPRALCPILENHSSYYTSNLPLNIQDSGPRQSQNINLNNQHVQAVSIPHPTPISSSSSKSPQTSKASDNIPTLTFNTLREENNDSPPMQTLYNEIPNHITNFSCQTINGYSPHKSPPKNNPTGQISNTKGQISLNCNGQTSKEIKAFPHKKPKPKPSNKKPLLFNTPLKNPKELFVSNRFSCPPKFQKRNPEHQIRPLFPLDRNRPYGNISSLNHQNPFKNSNVLNPKPGNIPKITHKSPIFAGRERAHRVLPSTYNHILTYPDPVTYKNNLNPTYRNIPPLIPSLFNKIFLPTGVALPTTLRGVFANGEYAPPLSPYQLSSMDSTILLNSYPKQHMYLTYGSIPWSSFMPRDRYAAFA
uniref:CCHC-type domain-containing protein n=1 Tax=Meloidogyne incognita TaxID=6306 RepID=A0A914LR93_MELIC